MATAMTDRSDQKASEEEEGVFKVETLSKEMYMIKSKCT